MRFTTGITLALLMSTTGCGGDDDDGGTANPLAPTGVMSSAPTDTTTAQSDGGLSDLNVDGMRSATVDKNTIDFSSVKWEWNDARSHLEPDSLPDARVRPGSNVWRRDSGTGLIRILSYTDLSGMSFMTAGSSWPLSMRRDGLYVSEISGADVERIRAGGGAGARVDPPALVCWPESLTRWASTSLLHSGSAVLVGINVRCNRDVTSTDDAVIKAAGHAKFFRNAISGNVYQGTWAPGPTDLNWLPPTPTSVGVRGGYGSKFPELDLTFSLASNPGNSARRGFLVWQATPPAGVTVPVLRPHYIVQNGRPSGSDAVNVNSTVELFCLVDPCPTRVGAGSNLSLGVSLSPVPKWECGIGQTYGNQNDNGSLCDWRLEQVVAAGSPPLGSDRGEFLGGGGSGHFIWRAPSSEGPVRIAVRYEKRDGSSWQQQGHSSNTLEFDVFEPTPPPDLRPHLSCDNGDTDSAIDKNGTSCDSIAGAVVMVTLTVTRPNGTTVSSLTYYVEWDVRGGVTRSIGSSHPTSTTSRGRHLLTWASTGLTTGDQGVVVAGVRPNGYDHAFNSNQVTIVMKERDWPPVLNAIACTPRVTPQGDNSAVCTATLDAPGGQGHLVDLSIDASDPNDDPLTYIWRAANGSFNGGVRTNRTTWNAAGLSTGQYTVTANVAERFTGVHTQDVVVHVVRYTPPVQIPVYTPYACTPDAGWENGSLSPVIGDAYCGQLHDRGYTWTGFTDGLDFRYYRAVGSSGQPEIELQEVPAFEGIGLREDHNRICGVSRGVCGEADSLYDTTVHSDGNNVYQWVNVYPGMSRMLLN